MSLFQEIIDHIENPPKNSDFSKLALRHLLTSESNLSIDNIVAILQKLEENKRNLLLLDLMSLGDYALTSSDILRIIKAAPSTVTKLNLGDNSLKNLEKSELLKIFSSINCLPNLQTLDLSYHPFFPFSGKEISEILSCLSSIKQLYLWHNNLGIDCNNQPHARTDFPDIFDNFPQSVRYLNLDGNKLGIIPIDHLVQAFSKIPNVETLKLVCSNLNELSIDELARLLNSINATTINLTANRFNELHGDKRKKLIDMLLASGKNIIIGGKLAQEIEDKAKRLAFFGVKSGYPEPDDKKNEEKDSTNGNTFSAKNYLNNNPLFDNKLLHGIFNLASRSISEEKDDGNCKESDDYSSFLFKRNY